MARPKRPRKDIEKALRYAESKGWTVEKAAAQAKPWGVMLCPERTRDGHRHSVPSTPKSDALTAQRIRRRVDHDPHTPTS